MSEYSKSYDSFFQKGEAISVLNKIFTAKGEDLQEVEFGSAFFCTINNVEIRLNIAEVVAATKINVSGVSTSASTKSVKREVLDIIAELKKIENVFSSPNYGENIIPDVQETIYRPNIVTEETSAEQNNENKYPCEFKFETEVKVQVDTNKITLVHEEGNSTINAKDIDAFSYSASWEGNIRPVTLLTRFIGISYGVVLIFGFLSDIGDGLVNFWSLIVNLTIASVVVFMIFMIDSVLQLGLFIGIIKSFFSTHLYSIRIGNSNGNNIDFIALLEEKEKIKNLEQVIKEVKELLIPAQGTTPTDATHVFPVADTQSPAKESVSNSSDLDDLLKLGELLKSGILTKEEFQKKKEEMLNGK
jgi:hypothetical protein